MAIKQKFIKLSMEPDYDFLLIAISSSLNDYNLTWALNKELNISLKREDDLIIEGEGSAEKIEFALYQCCKDENSLTLSLVANKSEHGFLVSALNNIDFFIKIDGELFDNEDLQLINKIKGIDGVLLVYKLTQELLPANHRKKFLSVFSTF